MLQQRTNADGDISYRLTNHVTRRQRAAKTHMHREMVRTTYGLCKTVVMGALFFDLLNIPAQALCESEPSSSRNSPFHRVSQTTQLTLFQHAEGGYHDTLDTR